MRRFLVGILALTAVACAESSGDPGDGGESSGRGSGGSGGTGVTSACGQIVDSARCLETGWCWDAPQPQAVQFEDVDGTPDGISVWAVGSLGGAFRRCEGAWVPIETGTDASLYGVWHPTPDVAVAVGEKGTVLRWDGEIWSETKAPTPSTLRTVWGSAPDDVWIGGEADDKGAVLLHWDGKSFQRIDAVAGWAFDILSIDGRGPADVFAVGGSFENDTSFHYDGTYWKPLPGPHGYPDLGPLSQVLALDDGSTYAIYDGYNTSRLFRFEGADWAEVLYRSYSGSLHALFEDGGGRAELIESSPGGAAPYQLLRNEGDAWTPTGETMPALPAAVWARPLSDEAWAAGPSSTLLGHTPGVWGQVPEIVAFPASPVFIGGTSEEDLWVITANHAAHRDASGWTVEAVPVDFVWEGNVDLAGRPWVNSLGSDLLYRDEGTWKTLSTNGASVQAMLANGPDDVWVTNDYDVMHFYGAVWEVYSDYCSPFHDPGSSGWLPDGRRFRRAPDGVVWLVGERGAFAFDASHDCRQLTGSGGATFDYDPLVDVAWTPAGDLWAVSGTGVLYHREGNYLMARGTPLAGLTNAYVTILQLTGTPSGKLRLAYSAYDEITGDRTEVITVDPSTGATQGAPLVAPATAVLWTPDEDHAVIAVEGGVMRYGYDQ
jgi:hypothetical protein